MYCPNCGALNYDNAKFCTECGAHMLNDRFSDAVGMKHPKRVKPKRKALQVFLTILIVVLVASSALIVLFAYLLDIYTYSTCDIDIQSMYDFIYEKTPEYKEMESEVVSLFDGDYIVAFHETYYLVDPEEKVICAITVNDIREMFQDTTNYVKLQNAGDFLYVQIDSLFPSLLEIGELNMKYTFRKSSLIERLDCLLMATMFLIENWPGG